MINQNSDFLIMGFVINIKYKYRYAYISYNSIIYSILYSINIILAPFI
jgi:hypothetical protein